MSCLAPEQVARDRGELNSSYNRESDCTEFTGLWSPLAQQLLRPRHVQQSHASS